MTCKHSTGRRQKLAFDDVAQKKEKKILTLVTMLSAITFHDESMSKLYKPNPYKFDLKFLVSNFFYFSYHRFVNA